MQTCLNAPGRTDQAALFSASSSLNRFFARDLLFGHVGEFEDEIDHLVFINRRTKLGQRVGIAAIVVPDFFLAAGHLARPLDHGAG